MVRYSRTDYGYLTIHFHGKPKGDASILPAIYTEQRRKMRRYRRFLEDEQQGVSEEDARAAAKARRFVIPDIHAEAFSKFERDPADDFLL